MKLLSAAICGPGCVREENQDNFYLNGIYRLEPNDNSVCIADNQAYDQALYAVADGMGGENYGEIASWIAVKSLDAFRNADGKQDITAYLMERNAEICDFIKAHNDQRSGSTFAGLIISGDDAEIVNIGDSRVYLFRGGQLLQISRDHTVVRQMVEMGVLSPEAARRHAGRHKLTQHLGIFPEEMVIEPYLTHGSVMPGDLFLLCSDGLYEMLDDSELLRIVSGRENLKDMAKRLFDVAMEVGGKDNITVLLVRAEET